MRVHKFVLFSKVKLDVFYLQAKSPWTTFLEDKYTIPLAICSDHDINLDIVNVILSLIVSLRGTPNQNMHFIKKHLLQSFQQR